MSDEILKREIRKLRKELKKEDNYARLTMIFLVIILLFQFIAQIKLVFAKRDLEKTKNELRQYKIYYQSIKNDNTYRAVLKCKESGKLKADCIIWELDK